MIAEVQEQIRLNEVSGLGLPLLTAPSVVIIEARSLIRECLALSLQKKLALPVLAYPDMGSWSRDPTGSSACIIILSGRETEIDARRSEIVHESSGEQKPVPVIVLSDDFSLDHMSDVIRNGAKGYIPSNTPLEVAAQAIRLVLSGGVFVPAQAAKEMWKTARTDSTANDPKVDFTARENDVVKALLKGKSNKVIAYELGMSASSVKVHIRNVMRKLQVRNRTEAVVKIAELVAKPAK
ncbi:response regulator transcription factor [Methylocystis echinoides]|jgi:DNA-binding NarL/FixJ family response regulator|uniref:response regulator transcription factor n=1 Tax=Methylocystis echinoides TaxID=29468 RepID=UPI003440116F